MDDESDFIKKVGKLTISDLGRTEMLETLRQESQNGPNHKLQNALLETKLTELHKRAGTYLEDCDGLWDFQPQELPEETDDRLELFNTIARTELRECYSEIDNYLVGVNKNLELPTPSMHSLGSSKFTIGDTDIFNNVYNKGRAHLIPDSPLCAPKWGHSAEGAFRPLKDFPEEKRNQARTLLVMGGHGAPKLRKSPQNFIKFAAHKEFFDVDPSVVIIPIMKLDDVKQTWQDGVPYDALVIASDLPNGRKARDAYQTFLPRYDLENSSYCNWKDIRTATNLVTSFLLGHAGSLAEGIPMELDPLGPGEEHTEKKKVVDELERVQKDIIARGVLLPILRKGKRFRKVLKIRFDSTNGAPIPDPWLLAAKAAVNLSSTRGQKLLPACEKAEEAEEDYEFWLGLQEYEKRRRQNNVPKQVNVCDLGAMPHTPPAKTSHSDAAVVTPPQEEGDDWENLGD